MFARDADYGSRQPSTPTTRYGVSRLARQPTLFRYDNIHPHPEHPTSHHRHRFDRNRAEIKPVEHVGVEGWPNLGEVIDELHALWQALLAR